MADPAQPAPVRVRGSWWARFRHDLGRRIEQRGFVVWYLICERGIRGIAVFVLGLYLFTVQQGQIANTVEAIESRYGLVEGGGGLIEHGVQYVLDQVVRLSATSLTLIAIGSVLYGLLEILESTGLILRRRWAEYLVVIATGFGIPLEVREVIVHTTLLRTGLLVINIAIVVYLVVRKRLFFLDEAAPA